MKEEKIRKIDILENFLLENYVDFNNMSIQEISKMAKQKIGVKISSTWVGRCLRKILKKYPINGKIVHTEKGQIFTLNHHKEDKNERD